MKVSVITATFNNFDELTKTLKSMEKVRNCESVVVNGGMCEKTKKFLGENKYINSISENDKGISDAFNKAIKLSKGEYFVILNSGDELIADEYYEKAVEFLDKNLKYDYVYSKGNYIKLDGSCLAVEPSMDKIFVEMPFMHETMVVRKNVVNKIGNFDLKYKVAMDYDLLIRMTMANMQGYYLNLNKPVVKMFAGGVSTKRALKGLEERFKTLFFHRALTCKTFFSILKLYLKVFLWQWLKRFGLLGIVLKLRGKNA